MLPQIMSLPKYSQTNILYFYFSSNNKCTRLFPFGVSFDGTARIGGFKVSDAITKHNSARGAITMEFPIGKFAGDANTIVKQ